MSSQTVLQARTHGFGKLGRKHKQKDSHPLLQKQEGLDSTELLLSSFQALFLALLNICSWRFPPVKSEASCWGVTRMGQQHHQVCATDGAMTSCSHHIWDPPEACAGPHPCSARRQPQTVICKGFRSSNSGNRMNYPTRSAMGHANVREVGNCVLTVGFLQLQVGF